MAVIMLMVMTNIMTIVIVTQTSQFKPANAQPHTESSRMFLDLEKSRYLGWCPRFDNVMSSIPDVLVLKLGLIARLTRKSKSLNPIPQAKALTCNPQHCNLKTHRTANTSSEPRKTLGLRFFNPTRPVPLVMPWWPASTAHR